MKNVYLSLVLLLMLLSGCARQTDINSIKIVPLPLKVEAERGIFKINSNLCITINDDSLTKVAELFIKGVEPIWGVAPKIKKGGRIILDIDTQLAHEEYNLVVKGSSIKVTGGSEAGVLYGLQTLKQLTVDDSKQIYIPAVEIHDKPQFAYRGVMLDVGRHFFSVDDVKKFIDIISLHKINTFHWHLTEDQGWRIEIKAYPELTNIGSIRRETLVGRYGESKKYDSTPYGGFYTQEEVKEIINYASERSITIIPEIELPGHALAALASYPELGCSGGAYEVKREWGVSHDVYCAGKESTFDFIKGVLTEIIELFPSEYIHIGGDECPKSKWKECPACQQRMRDEGLNSEHNLQTYFMNRVERWMNKRGKKAIGWDEILEGDISKSATVMTWRSAEVGAKAAARGNSVIQSPLAHCYMDYYQTSNPQENDEPIAMWGIINMRKAYQLDPYLKVDSVNRARVLGVQANVWTEYMKDMDHVEYMLLPRLAAISEVAWSEYDEKRDYDNFMERLPSLVNIYAQYGYNYAPYAFSEVE